MRGLSRSVSLVRPSPRGVPAAALAVIFAVTFLSAAMAQQLPRVQPVPSASEITPPSFRPPIEAAPQGGGLVVPTTTGLDTPPGAETLFVRLRGVRVEGGFPQLAAATQSLEARLVAKGSVSGAEIFDAARELEAAYASAGFVLARVVLPPQELNDDGVLQLLIVDGFIESLETTAVPHTVKSRIVGLLSPLIGRRGVTLAEIERRVLLAGDTYGVSLRSTLVPGAAKGGTVLALDARYQPVSAVLSFDNTLPQAFNTYTFGVGVDINSVLGWGELFYLRAFGNPFSNNGQYLGETPLNRALAGGIVVPIGNDGFTFNVEATKAQTTPVSAIPNVLTTSDFERLSFRGRYPWIRGRQLDFASEVSFDVENDKQSIWFNGVSLPLSEDRLRILRIALDGQYAAPWAANLSGRLITSIGLNTLGARTATDAVALGVPLSRQGADASFAKLEASLVYVQSVFDGFLAALNLRGQTSFGAVLARAERFGIASPSGLSTFDAGTFVGDSGYVARGEFGKPFVLPEILTDWAFMAQPYAFGAVGQIVNTFPTILEYGSVTAASYGIGVRLNDAEKGTRSGGSLTLEFGAQQRSDGIPAGVRFNVLFSQRF